MIQGVAEQRIINLAQDADQDRLRFFGVLRQQERREHRRDRESGEERAASAYP